MLEDALQGGVNDSLNLDTRGKLRSAVLLAMTIDVPEDHPALRLKAAQVMTSGDETAAVR